MPDTTQHNIPIQFIITHIKKSLFSGRQEGNSSITIKRSNIKKRAGKSRNSKEIFHV